LIQHRGILKSSLKSRKFSKVSDDNKDEEKKDMKKEVYIAKDSAEDIYKLGYASDSEDEDHK
jgi:hypothetical protein